MLEGFQISHGTTPGGTLLLRVKGRLDNNSASVLVDRCAAARAAGQNLVLNLSGVSLIASGGVGALLALAEEFRDSPARLRLASLSPTVHSVVKLLDLERFLTIDATEDQALAALER